MLALISTCNYVAYDSNLHCVYDYSFATNSRLLFLYTVVHAHFCCRLYTGYFQLRLSLHIGLKRSGGGARGRVRGESWVSEGKVRGECGVSEG